MEEWLFELVTKVRRLILAICFDNLTLRAASGFFQQHGDIALIINTDGVSVYRTSNKHAWGIWAIDASLPPCERYKQDNLMLLGIFFSEEKPNLTYVLAPVLKDLKENRSEFVVETPNGLQSCRVRVLAFVMDMDARVRFMVNFFCNHVLFSFPNAVAGAKHAS